MRWTNSVDSAVGSQGRIQHNGGERKSIFCVCSEWEKDSRPPKRWLEEEDKGDGGEETDRQRETMTKRHMR